jgi:hypothetical protein
MMSRVIKPEKPHIFVDDGTWLWSSSAWPPLGKRKGRKLSSFCRRMNRRWAKYVEPLAIPQ